MFRNYIFGGVHKWRHLHFEIFDPSLPSCHLFYKIGLYGVKSAFSISRSPHLTPKWVRSFMDGPFKSLYSLWEAAVVFEVLGTFLRLLVKPRLASARDKLALTDSRLKLNSPLKLLGTFKPGKPSILVLGLIFFVIGAVFWLELNLFHNLFIIAQQLWTTWKIEKKEYLFILIKMNLKITKNNFLVTIVFPISRIKCILCY